MSFYEMVPEGLKKPVEYLVALFVLGLVLSSFAFAWSYGVSAWKEAHDSDQPRNISVAGEGKIEAKPDVAVFTVSVVTQAETVGEAQGENTKRSNDILEFLKKEGVAEKDLKTMGYNIQPQQQYFDNPPCYASPCPIRKPPEIVAYEVRNSLEVKVRDFNKTDDLLSGVVEYGANEVGSVYFKIDDEEKIKEEARKKAIEDAKKKAKILAKDLGVRIKRIVSFSESGGDFPYQRAYAEKAYGMGGGADSVAATPQIEPGEQEVRVFVSVTYEFR